MTREEAKKKLWATGNINSLSKVECDNILNLVYDDFKKEKESLKKEYYIKGSDACFSSLTKNAKQ